MIHLFEASELESPSPGVWRTPPVSVDLPARSLVASWNHSLSPGQTLEVWARMQRRGEWSAWGRIGARGGGAAGLAPELPPGTTLEADEWVSDPVPLEAGQLELRGPEGDPPRRLGLATWPVFAPVALPEDPVDPLLREGRVLQYLLPTEESGRLCGPSCLTMALRHFGIPCDPMEVAAEVHDPWASIYGNWSLLAARAGELGLAAWVERGGGPVRLARHLAAGRLAILSLRWEEHELAGAPLPSSRGHLVLAVGCLPEGCLVMDPAFRDPDLQLHCYEWQGLLRAWKSGASVVIGPDPSP